MAKGIWVVFTNCADQSRHEEFNSWYSHTHLPDLSASRGFVRARRYANAYPDEGPSQYLALYEFEDEDISVEEGKISIWLPDRVTKKFRFKPGEELRAKFVKDKLIIERDEDT